MSLKDKLLVMEFVLLGICQSLLICFIAWCKPFIIHVEISICSASDFISLSFYAFWIPWHHLTNIAKPKSTRIKSPAYDHRVFNSNLRQFKFIKLNSLENRINPRKRRILKRKWEKHHNHCVQWMNRHNYVAFTHFENEIKHTCVGMTSECEIIRAASLLSSSSAVTLISHR